MQVGVHYDLDLHSAKQIPYRGKPTFFRRIGMDAPRIGVEGIGQMRKGHLLGLIGLIAVLVLSGCGGKQTAGCAPIENGVGVCLEGTAVSWTANVRPPHMHEPGGYYAPVQDLAKTLGVMAEVSSDQKSVSVNGKQVLAIGPEAQGIHLHDDLVYAPIKEFAEAAGYKVSVDPSHHTVSISR